MKGNGTTYLGVFVEHAGVDRGGQEIVGGRDGVDVTGEVEIHLLHGQDLSVPTSRRAALDPERRALGGLTDARHGGAVEMRSEGLDESDRRGALAFAERVWVWVWVWVVRGGRGVDLGVDLSIWV